MQNTYHGKVARINILDGIRLEFRKRIPVIHHLLSSQK